LKRLDASGAQSGRHSISISDNSDVVSGVVWELIIWMVSSTVNGLATSAKAEEDGVSSSSRASVSCSGRQDDAVVVNNDKLVLRAFLLVVLVTDSQSASS